MAALLSLGRPGLELYMLDPPDWIPIGDGMRPVFTIPIAALVTGVIGFIIGIPALRLGGISLALATLAIAVSFPILMKRFAEVTGGGGGLNLNLPGDAVRLGHLHAPLALLRSLGHGRNPVPARLAAGSGPDREGVALDP